MGALHRSQLGALENVPSPRHAGELIAQMAVVDKELAGVEAKGLFPVTHACCLSRRCSCTAASSCAGRWTRAPAAPRAAGGGCAGRLGERRRRERRRPVTWQSTS